VFEFWAFYGMPFSDKDGAIVVDVNLSVPWQAVIASVDLIRLAVIVEGG